MTLQAGFLVIFVVITTANSLTFHSRNVKPHLVDMRLPKEPQEALALGYPFPERHELNEMRKEIDEDENYLLLKQAADKAFDKNGMIYLTQPKNDPDVPNITYLLTKLVSYKTLNTGSSLRMSPKDFFTKAEMKSLKEMNKAIKEEKLLNLDENVPLTLDDVRDDIVKQFKSTLKHLEMNLQEEKGGNQI